MKLSIVLNEGAGTLLGQPVDVIMKDIRDIFVHAGHEPTIVAASGPEIHDTIKQATTDPHADAVIVGGGDGSVATGANEVLKTGKIFGVLPLGTLNLFAKDIGMPLNIQEATRSLAYGTIKSIDAGEVNGQIFLCHSILGLYPRIVQDREEQREKLGRHKWTAMAVAAYKSLKQYPLLDIELLARGRHRHILTPALAVTNNPYDDGFGSFLSRSQLDTGQLALYVARHRNPWRMARLMAGLALGDWQQDTELEVHSVTELTVKSRRRHLTVANDGEVMQMESPLRYRIRPKGLRIISPVIGPPA